MKKVNLIYAGLFTVILSFSAFSEESTLEKVETGKNKAVDQVKHSYRGAKDKTCEMVNGKMNCIGKKLKHKAGNMTDSTKTKATEVKNQVD